jgi:diguanylate cyclase (GGDEF)-like protein
LSASQFSITQRIRIMRPDSIRSRILLFAILATLLPSLATAWFSYLENKRSLTAKASEALLNASTQTARELDLWTKERRYDLRVFASSYEVTENLERIPRAGGPTARTGRPQQRLRDYLDSVSERFTDYTELLILDPEGRVVASSGVQSDVLALPPDWRAQMRSESLVVGTPYSTATDNQPQMLIAVPIGVAGERVLGALAAKVNLQSLADTLKRFAPGESGKVYTLREDGSLIISSWDSSANVMKLRYPPGAMQSHLDSQARPVEFTNVVGEHVVGSMRHVPGLDWVVVAEIPSAEVFGQLGHLRNVTLLIVTGMLAIAGILGYALGLFIVRPLDRLTRGAAKVAGGDLDVDLPVAKSGEVAYLTEVFNDMVARLRSSRRELERLSVTDPLTGLNNRRRMMEVLDNEVRRSRRLNHNFTVLMADIDFFKRYNDAHGHPAGDQVLKRVANVLRETTRDVDFIARYGGEEFFVLMPEVNGRGAAEVVKRIRARLAVERFPAGSVTMSFGVAEFPANGDSGDTLIAVADAALYQAKNEGRDQLVVAPVVEPVRASGR